MSTVTKLIINIHDSTLNTQKIIDYLQSFQWYNDRSYIVNVKKNESSIKTDIELNNFDNNGLFYNSLLIYLKDLQGNFIDSFYLRLLSKQENKEKVCCIIIFQYGDEFRDYILGILEMKNKVKNLENLFNGGQIFLSYDGDREEFNISYEKLEKCILSGDFSSLDNCRVQ